MNYSDEIEKKILKIYNPSNHLINAQNITDIYKICGIDYQPKNLGIFQLCLTHKSYVIITNPEIEYEQLDHCVELRQESNERLEYLGDSIIGSIVSTYLYHRYTKQNEGFLTKIKTKLVRTNMLAKFSLCLGLDQHVLISKHVEDMCGGRTNERIMEDTFEAFIGAMFEDMYQNDERRYGLAMQMCADFIIRLIEDNTDFRPLISVNDNYKELLLQYYHKTWGGIHPIYHEINVEGPTNKRVYTMGVKHPITNQLIGQGKDRRKTVAEQMASKEALAYFEKHLQHRELGHILPQICGQITSLSPSVVTSSDDDSNPYIGDY